ncbi:hypothetical protein BO83DRAFT_189503 [Aspergillus eucalypticola CBS 122712]|uniref:Secreted protein n=1 Tax=Aspergillus eucalypticola (strain CBS 122712 / IBT 29274) TaxID=1448314 RepID=A0A317UKN7_ASPEC|nr:uncharacterized protein BO83DRAFT_189503 [Aspergillus eucalypticola CBS 122712]PWY62564.1 hypothetical protein BO83DRAFT_189503 [Aspergillus eucalypticola CBS 122712]
MRPKIAAVVSVLLSIVCLTVVLLLSKNNRSPDHPCQVQCRRKRGESNLTVSMYISVRPLDVVPPPTDRPEGSTACFCQVTW